MNIACSTAAFSTRPLPEALRRIRAMGFAHVDLLAMHGWAHIDPSEVAAGPSIRAREAARLLREHRLAPVALNAGVAHPLSTLDPAEADRNRLEVRGLIAFAHELSIPVVVLQPGRGATDRERAMEASIEALRQAAAYGAERKVTVAIETHSGSLAERYDEALRFVAEVEGLKLAYDPSHFVMGGLDLRASAALLPHTAHVHLRDAVAGNFQTPMGSGTLDFLWVLEAIDGCGYGAAISIEYLDNRSGPVHSDVAALKTLLESRYRHV